MIPVLPDAGEDGRQNSIGILFGIERDSAGGSAEERHVEAFAHPDVPRFRQPRLQRLNQVRNSDRRVFTCANTETSFYALTRNAVDCNPLFVGGSQDAAAEMSGSGAPERVGSLKTLKHDKAWLILVQQGVDAQQRGGIPVFGDMHGPPVEGNVARLEEDPSEAARGRVDGKDQVIHAGMRYPQDG